MVRGHERPDHRTQPRREASRCLKSPRPLRRTGPFPDTWTPTWEAGDAFVIGPGHTPLVFAGGEFIAFTRTDEARREDAVVLPNVMRFAQEHGIELPDDASAPGGK